jgi:hypothetical protein
MVARVARFEGVNVQEVERTIGEAEARIRPIVEGLGGFRGYLDAISSDGQVLSITLFETDEDAEAAEETFDVEMPQKLGDLFAGWEGRRVSVDRYKVLANSLG